ncbi:MAG: hypothetical protein KDK97_13905 [Verrucomicrobiales bacterium]|nr:hypothetical protein [Verrucomicrobiales bacterium]MCP5558549.1 hypothetical protein [Verrucomicrobiaceae bacterium]
MANKRINRRRHESTQDLLATERKTEVRRRAPRAPREVASEIERLECFIAAAPRLARQQKLSRLNYVPPIERESVRPGTNRLPLHRERAINLEKAMLIGKLALTLSLIGAALGWLNQSLHFLR